VNARGLIDKRIQKESQVWVENLDDNVNLQMVSVPAGSFEMGSSATQVRRLRSEYTRHGAVQTEVSNVLRRETPQHEVTLKALLIGRTEVTQAQWAVVASWPSVERKLLENPSEAKDTDQPVTNISWFDAEEFCRRLSTKTRRVYRLPSEAEWEYACRAGTQTAFALGATISPAVANYHSRYPFGSVRPSPERAAPVSVASLPLANAFGLYDMHGNVWEWCADPWHDSYKDAPADGSAWTEAGDAQQRPVRGGGWNDIAFLARSGARASQPVDNTSSWVGFRVVLEP
jgi:formylglycine-generating enzyme required for sulfatase activity